MGVNVVNHRRDRPAGHRHPAGHHQRRCHADVLPGRARLQHHEGDHPHGARRHQDHAPPVVRQQPDQRIKIVVPVNDPNKPPAPDGIIARRHRLPLLDHDHQQARTSQYWTACSTAAGHKIVWPRRPEVRPGVVIAMVEDPDGNWVEFIQSA